MMLPFLGFLGFILIMLFICEILVVRLITICIKVGFINGIKSKEAIIILVLLTLILLSLIIGVPAYLIYSFITPHTGEEITKIYLINPVPKSVKILESYDGWPDLVPEICLHFKIAPADLKLILDSKKWEQIPEAKSLGAQCNLDDKTWDFSFPPPALGDNVKTYTFSPHKKDVEYLFFNSQMNEVYYFNIDSGYP